MSRGARLVRSAKIGLASGVAGSVLATPDAVASAVTDDVTAAARPTPIPSADGGDTVIWVSAVTAIVFAGLAGCLGLRRRRAVDQPPPAAGSLARKASSGWCLTSMTKPCRTRRSPWAR
jgi:hypothetical protein